MPWELLLRVTIRETKFRTGKHHIMKKLYIPLFLTLITLTGCQPATKKSPEVDNRIRIRVSPVQYREYKIPVITTGLLGTTTQVKLSFKTGGIIKQINVKEGESVSRGEVLAVLDLSEVKARVSQARIGFEKAGRDLKRAENLYRDSVATLEQYQNANSAFEVAKSQKQIAEFNLVHSQIKAPSAGKIQKILVESNEMIAPGYPAILFASTENDWVVRSMLTDKDIVKLSLGDSGRVTMDAFPGIEFLSEVSELGPVADPVTGTYEAELDIREALPQFRTGFISRVRIYPTEISRSLVVPLESLLDASDRSASVFTYRDGKTRKRNISIGPILDDYVVVQKGLEEGEMIVTDGARYLRNDSGVILVSRDETEIR